MRGKRLDCKVTAAPLTFLYGLGDFLRISGQVKIRQVGLQVTYRTLPSCHTKPLYGQT